MNYFDIGIIAIVLLAMLLGFAKGFSKSLASLFGWLVSVIIAVLLAKTVATALLGVPFISKYFFDNPNGFSFANWIYGILPEGLRIDMTTVRSWVLIDGQVVENASDILLNSIKDENSLLGIFMGLFKGSYLESLASPEMLSYNIGNLAQAIALLLAHSLLILFTGIFILIVLKIITNILMSLAKKNSGFKKEVSIVSRFLGLAVGAVKGALTCAAIFVILSFMINFPFLSSARQKLLNDDSLIAGNFATTVFEWTDKLLETEDLSKLMKNSGYEKITDGEENGDTDSGEKMLIAYSYSFREGLCC